MKIGRRDPSKSNNYHQDTKSSLLQTRDKVRKVTRKIPHAFKVGKIRFSKLQANNKVSEKTSHLFTQKIKTFNS